MSHELRHSRVFHLARPSRGGRLWPTLPLLLLAIVMPAAGVLWFMSVARDNERLAFRQKFRAANLGQLDVVREQLAAFWEERMAAAPAVNPDAPAAETFARLVKDGVAESFVVYSSTGVPQYPTLAPTSAEDVEPESPEWRTAEDLEYDKLDFPAAADAYARIARQADDVHVAARALRAQARCLARAGEKDTSIELLTGTLSDPAYRLATDRQGRLVQPGALLRGLQLLIGEPAGERFRASAGLLRELLSDYRTSALTSSQRRFLMHELRGLVPDGPGLDTLAAEDLAAAYLEAHGQPSDPGVLHATPVPGVWQWRLPGRRLVALFREDGLLARLQARLTQYPALPGATIRVLPPGANGVGFDPALTVPIGRTFPEWKLAGQLDDQSLLATATERRVAGYLWAGILLVVAMALLVLLVGGYLRRQVRLSVLKSDLTATVSHELKTPLASMRALADTLLAGNYRGEKQLREYLQLITAENARLSRVIDNFLTFSRIERNGQSFTLVDVDVREIVDAAVQAVGERSDVADCRLDLEIEADLPTIHADRDAMVMVLVNLLDNAYKYSNGEGRISVRVYAAEANICLEVKDNGIGLSRRDAKRIFDRFHQVDRHLSRKSGGCGLGLSIVKHLVGAHGGTIDVDSQPGRGSTFTVKFPRSRHSSSRKP